MMKLEVFGAGALLAVYAFAAEPYPGTIRDWLVSGPWPSYHGESKDSGLDTDFLDLEADAVPVPGAKAESTFIADKAKLIAGIGSCNEWGFKETKTFDASWRELRSEKDIISLDRRFAPIDDYFAAYAACYVEVPEAMDARIAVGSDDDHMLWLDLKRIGRKATSQGVVPGEFKYDVHLTPGTHRILLKVVDRTNGCGFHLAVTDRSDKAIPGLKVHLDPRGKSLVIDAQKAAARTPEKLTKANAALEKEIADLKSRLPGLEARSAELKKELERAEKRLADGYDFVEDAYAKKHARMAAKGVKSVDEPLPPAPSGLRRRLCVNGEWELSGDGGKTWERRHVPIKIIDCYFAASTYPVARTNPKTPWCRYTNCVGFADFAVSDALFARKAKLRTHFNWDGNGRVNFVCEGIIGTVRFSCNGTPCGEYDGRVGIVTIPMKGMVKGDNLLEVGFEWAWYQVHHNSDGLIGDVFFDYVGDVRVSDVYAKPSWRKASLVAEAEIVNDRADKVSVEVRQMAVKDGRVRLRLPSTRTDVPAGGMAQVSTSSGWADPVLWGIGGKYGDPEMYDLVTDVLMDGKVVDRHVQPFGFREFWIRHTDFFLNGHRIILQGDVGHSGICMGRVRDIFWPLLRADGINVVRYHDSEFTSINAARGADRMGMLSYLQMYPNLHEPGGEKKPGPDNFSPFEKWESTKTHAWNLANYKRWFRAFRNSPSAVIWSTDNEIFTQAWDTAGKSEWNLRNDKIGTLYEKYMKQLDPGLVLTRDGDVGTWGHAGRWYEDPPCDTANYHYPDFNVSNWVRDWQKVYDWRPAVFGETLYCSYGAWDKYIGAIPSQVAKKAARVRQIASLYRKLGVPAQIYMGLSSDGFIQRDDSGKGDPRGITESQYQAWRKKGVRPPDQAEDQYPWFRIPWPALSGSEFRPIAKNVAGNVYGYSNLNFYDVRYPTHVRNAVNDAYRDSLIPQPQLRIGSDAEVVIEAKPFAEVWATSPDGAQEIGVLADAQGRAWFRFLNPGLWRFSCGRDSASLELAPRGPGVTSPGFGGIKFYRLGSTR